LSNLFNDPEEAASLEIQAGARGANQTQKWNAREAEGEVDRAGEGAGGRSIYVVSAAEERDEAWVPKDE
jgi:hypothetical protein